MASVEETIRLSLLNYPGLYENRTDCLSHILCSPGNGYDWHKGELYHRFAKTDRIKTDPSFAYHTDWKQNLKALQKSSSTLASPTSDFLQEMQTDLAKHNANRMQHVLEHIEHLTKTPTPMVMGPRKRLESSFLVIFPDQIKPDWAEALKETAQAVIDFYTNPVDKIALRKKANFYDVSFSRLCKTTCDNHKEFAQKDIALAKETLQRLEKFLK